MVRVTIYNEFQHERNEERIRRVYPEGIHMCLKRFLESDDIKVTTITLDDVKNGISDELLHDTDVMIWWGHMAHQLVPDEVAVKVCRPEEVTEDGRISYEGEYIDLKVTLAVIDSVEQ